MTLVSASSNKHWHRERERGEREDRETEDSQEVQRRRCVNRAKDRGVKKPQRA